MKEKITITIDSKILSNIDTFIDKVYIRNRSQAISYLLERKLNHEKTAVILATGPSEELRISKSEFRPTASIRGTSVIEVAISTLRDYGFRKIFIIGEQMVLTSIFNKIGNGRSSDVEVTFIEDKNPPGTAASLRLIKGEIKGTFLGVYGDIIFNHIDIAKLWKHHFTHSGLATLMASQYLNIKGGIQCPFKTTFLDIDGNMVKKVYPSVPINKLDKYNTNLAKCCLFVAEPTILSYPGNWLDEDVFLNLAEKGLLNSYISNHGEIHIHSKEDVKIANQIVVENINY